MGKSKSYIKLLILSLIISLSLRLAAQTDYWISKNNGLTVLLMRDMAINSVGDLFAIVGFHGAFVSTDGGESWHKKNNGLTNLEVLCVAVNSKDDVFIGTANGMFKSTNKGDTWYELDVESNFNRYAKIIESPNGYLFAVATFEGVLRSTDNGNTWENVNNGLAGSGGIRSLFADFHGQILAGTDFGRIYFTNSYGEGWTESSTGLPLVTTAPVISIIENRGENYFAGTGQGLYCSTDYGINWSQVHNGGGNGYVHSLFVDHGDNLFIGTGSSGVYMTPDNGTSWQELNSGLTHLGIYSIVMNSEGYIFVATGEGVFKSNERIVSVNQESEPIPTEFKLHQNYPNPFNPTTVIKYDLPVSGRVTLAVFDILGREIIKLIENEQSSGYHNVEFDARNLSSGIYIYKIATSQFSHSQKMVLIK